MTRALVQACLKSNLSDAKKTRRGCATPRGGHCSARLAACSWAWIDELLAGVRLKALRSARHVRAGK
eukprot:6176184-Pleurochrysis_carterae.AAC.2